MISNLQDNPDKIMEKKVNRLILRLVHKARLRPRPLSSSETPVVTENHDSNTPNQNSDNKTPVN